MGIVRYGEGTGLLDSTPVENMFLIEYLPGAPDDCLRVYLYARMLCLHPELGSEQGDIARALHLDEERVADALAYWEQQGLMLRVQDKPLLYEILPVRASRVREDPEAYELRDMNMRLQALFGANLLHPQEYMTSALWVKELGFSQDAVVYFVEERAKKSRAKKPDLSRLFKKLDREAALLADKGVRTLDEMKRALEEGGADEAAQAVLARLSIRRAPTADETALARKWREEWGLTKEEILDACRDTVKARDPSFAYLDRILDSRRSGDTEEEIRPILRELGSTLPPSPEEKRQIRAWIGEGFEPGTLELAAIQCSRKRRRTFDDLAWMVNAWRDEGLFTRADAEAYIEKNRVLTGEVREILAEAGTDRRPTLSDVRAYGEWKEKYPRELITCAAGFARGMQSPMRYMGALLAGWEAQGVRDAQSARAAHAARAKAGPGGAAGQNPALNYQQSDIPDDAFGKGFFVDLDGGEDGGK